MLLSCHVETHLVCWKKSTEEAHLFTLNEIDTQFTSKWARSDIVKENQVWT